MPVPLQYRWKHMEKALAWTTRCRGWHAMLDRSLKKVFTPAEVARAGEAPLLLMPTCFSIVVFARLVGR